MAEYAIYWPYFSTDEWPCPVWNTSRDWLANRVRAGDVFWLFTSGECFNARFDTEEFEPQQAFLVELFEVESAGHHPDFPEVRFRFTITGNDDLNVAIDPPLPIDDIMRQAGRDADEHIGLLRQTPQRLDHMT